jgi:Ca2+/Na+ antiporter
MMFVLKIIPIYTIWNTKITFMDVYVTIILFILYLIWMHIHKKNTNDFIGNTKKLIFYNKNTLPGMQLLEKIGI